MLDPGALGTLIIRNNAERGSAERLTAGVADAAAADERTGTRMAVARRLRRLATLLAGPERSEAPPPGAPAVPSLGLTWSDR